MREQRPLITAEEVEAVIQKHGAYDTPEEAIRDLVVFLHGQVRALTATMDVAVKMIESGRFGEPTEEDNRRILKMRKLLTALTQDAKQN